MQLRWLDNLRHLVLRLKDHLLGVLLLLVIDEFLLIILLVLHVHLLLEIIIVTKESVSLLTEIDALPLYLLEVLLQVRDSLLQVGNLASETQDSSIPHRPLTANSPMILGEDTDSVTSLHQSKVQQLSPGASTVQLLLCGEQQKVLMVHRLAQVTMTRHIHRTPQTVMTGKVAVTTTQLLPVSSTESGESLMHSSSTVSYTHLRAHETD